MSRRHLPTVMGSGASRDIQPEGRRCDAFSSGHPGQCRSCNAGALAGRSGLMLGAQQHESVLDAFFEDLIGELLVGQGAG